MRNKKRDASSNTAMAAFKQAGELPKGYMRNRLFAQVVDFFVIAFLCQLIFQLFGTPDWGQYLQMQDAVRGLAAADPLVIERAALYQECFIISLAVGAIYETLTLLLFSTTFGKLIFRQRVVSAKEGRNAVVSKLLLVARAVIKMASVYLLSALPFIFMCLTAFGNAERRSGFDMFAGTKVMDMRRKRQ